MKGKIILDAAIELEARNGVEITHKDVMSALWADSNNASRRNSMSRALKLGFRKRDHINKLRVLFPSTLLEAWINPTAKNKYLRQLTNKYKVDRMKDELAQLYQDLLNNMLPEKSLYKYLKH